MKEITYCNDAMEFEAQGRNLRKTEMDNNSELSEETRQ